MDLRANEDIDGKSYFQVKLSKRNLDTLVALYGQYLEQRALPVIQRRLENGDHLVLIIEPDEVHYEQRPDSFTDPHWSIDEVLNPPITVPLTEEGIKGIDAKIEAAENVG